MQVLTLDFHNTLAACDPWFDLEVRTLPRAVGERLARGHSVSDDAIDASYRKLREQVIRSGVEIDAYEGVALVLEHHEIPVSRSAIELTVDALMLQALDAMGPMPGAVETVRRLHSDGIPLGIVSSAVHHQTIEWTLRRLGIDNCFQTVVTSASCGFYKSTPAIYDIALAALGGVAAASVHVGDSLRWDVAIAQQAGLNTVWLQTPRKSVFAPDPVDITPSLTLPGLEAAGPILCDMLRALRANVNV